MKAQNLAATQRLASLDILRGFDLFLLVFLQPVLFGLLSRIDASWTAPILYQLDHEPWEGFRFWDIIMPLFLFMSGASMPFSFSKLLREKTKTFIYKKVLKRFVILFVLGAVVQGHLLSLDWEQVRIYTNTLQAIGTGYLFTALIILNCRFKVQVLISFLLLAVYSIPFLMTGDYTLEGNFAYKVDECILGHFRGDLSYTWVWSSLTFTVTVLFGSFAGHIIKELKDQKKRVVKLLFGTGLGLVVLAMICQLEIPIIKHIWSTSMTLLSGGYCFLLMGLFYFWIDYRGHLKGLEWLKIYGMNSIVAYMVGEVINFRSVAQSVSFGLEQYLGDFYPVWLTFFNYAILFYILHLMYKHKIFIKI